MKSNPVNFSTLRQIWSLIEETHTSTLLSLDEAGLVNYLLRQLQNTKTINLEEISLVRDYLDDKITLIRDLADSRLVAPQNLSS